MVAKTHPVPSKAPTTPAQRPVTPFEQQFIKESEAIANPRDTFAGLNAVGEVAQHPIHHQGHALSIPRVGQPWPEQGGIYAGILRGLPGEADAHLIVSTEKQPDAEWGTRGKRIDGADCQHDGRANTQAMAASGNKLAQAILACTAEGHTDWHLPSIRELHLIYATCPEALEPRWTWSSTQYGASTAWYMGFAYGFTLISYKDYDAQVRPVRRIPA